MDHPKHYTSKHSIDVQIMTSFKTEPVKKLDQILKLSNNNKFCKHAVMLRNLKKKN